MTTILLVEDEQVYAELFSESLNMLGVNVVTVDGYNEAVKALSTNTEIQAVISDFDFGSSTENGFQMANYVVKNFPQMPIAMISAYGSEQVLADLSQLGVYDFLRKPVSKENVESLIDSFKKTIARNEEDKIAPVAFLNNVFIGESDVMTDLKLSITRLSKTKAPVLIRGESGVGKELVAKSIHGLSSRGDGPMINVNCGSINESLIESTLFGYKKGAFTGADKDKQGLIAAANNGTLFLDEVGELSLAMQASLLRVLQEKKVRAVGDENEQAVDFRLITATHKDLEQMVKDGEFRQDLYYRIDVTRLNVPALRDRGDDVLHLAEHLVNKISEDFGLIPKPLSSPFKDWLKVQNLNGNVRELQNILSKALLDCQDTNEVLPPTYQDRVVDTNATIEILEDNSLEEAKSMGLELFLEKAERDILQKAMDACNQKTSEVAKILKIDVRALRYRLKKLGVGNLD